MIRRRVAVLLSGRGTTLQCLLDAQGALCPYEIAFVVSNDANAYGLTRAADAGVEAMVVDHRPFGKNREAFDRQIDAALRARDIEIIALGGFMRIFSPWFTQVWAGRMLNIHPSLLPAFPGLHPHRQALAAGVRVHGCTVHWVTEAVDAGPIIGQAAVPVLPNDTEETLAARTLEAEHLLYPACLSLACGGPQLSAGVGEPVLANAFNLA